MPPEWRVDSATLEGPDGPVCSWEDNPLHLMGYSVPTIDTMSGEELARHIYAAPDPSVIPYTTSYYESHWGFNLSDSQPAVRPEGRYHVDIRTDLDVHGKLDYADLVIPGRESSEVLFSTYTCHPNLANDNVSGMVVQTALAEWILSEPRKHTYRFVWCPETIGALVYLQRHLGSLQRNVIAGFVLSCVGDDQNYSMVESRTGRTYADRVGRHVMNTWPRTMHYQDLAGALPLRNHDIYNRMQPGSDERQYASPLANLPVVCLSRSKFGTFPEYHTSADDMSVISAEGLGGSLDMLKDCVRILEANGRFRAKFVGDAQLGRRGLYPTLGHGVRDKRYQHVLSLSDGEHDVIDIAERTGLGTEFVIEALDTLRGHGLVEAL